MVFTNSFMRLSALVLALTTSSGLLANAHPAFNGDRAAFFSMETSQEVANEKCRNSYLNAGATNFWVPETNGVYYYECDGASPAQLTCCSSNTYTNLEVGLWDSTPCDMNGNPGVNVASIPEQCQQFWEPTSSSGSSQKDCSAKPSQEEFQSAVSICNAIGSGGVYCPSAYSPFKLVCNSETSSVNTECCDSGNVCGHVGISLTSNGCNVKKEDVREGCGEFPESVYQNALNACNSNYGGYYCESEDSPYTFVCPTGDYLNPHLSCCPSNKVCGHTGYTTSNACNMLVSNTTSSSVN
ncbi:hypothetical protein K493DRAFT_372948 [Basidiobolus meristosporus CBS 931.73]|uniref:Chitin-binding type-2 domain-containing protein n=1 Tax=Basidiobolus meristosporus CBS 931.73 TaxID=1314790 RepID=A0A1Y1Z781_9FUNG|nr:hypothetical protein K493DRAFT_372948 [Basidiobolus meristosporus CBS 931.73]|eukprot:ORY06120.1 hypothetical protein K493DRAFT_372948 [Basidiobolus meristosporus CBS 931.73]